MPKLSQVMRNWVVVEIDSVDGDANPIKVPVKVKYRRRLMTLDYRDQFAEHMRVLVKAEEEAKAARESGKSEDEITAIAESKSVVKASDEIARMTMALLESWDLEDEDEEGKPIPLPIPQTTDEVKRFPDPQLFQAVMGAVMAALNPNQEADEKSTKVSSAS